MASASELPLPVLDALPLGAHRLMTLTDEALFNTCGVRIAYTGREGGMSTGPYASLNCSFDIGDDEQTVIRNRAIICEAAGVPGIPVASLNQVHGTRIVEVAGDEDLERIARGPRQEADGLLISRIDVAAFLIAADCPLGAVVSPSGRFVVFHAGWRGAVSGIAGKAASLLASADPFDPPSYNAYIGPHICADCFEVGKDVSERFAERFGGSCVPDERHVSLARAISIDLSRAGVAVQRIADAGVCTKCNPDRYFSYRGTDGNCGRQGVFVAHLAGR